MNVIICYCNNEQTIKLMWKIYISPFALTGNGNIDNN